MAGSNTSTSRLVLFFLERFLELFDLAVLVRPEKAVRLAEDVVVELAGPPPVLKSRICGEQRAQQHRLNGVTTAPNQIRKYQWGIVQIKLPKWLVTHENLQHSAPNFLSCLAWRGT